MGTFYRSFINFHTYKCKGKAVTCQVLGCSTIVRRGEMRAHLMESASSHIKVQFEEIQRLRRTIPPKVLKKLNSNIVPSLITFS